MATDATLTPTSPDLIPKYNTSVDSPSGNGFNAAMDTIQSIVTQLKAGTLASGKLLASALSGVVPVANLGSGTPDVSTVLLGTGVWTKGLSLISTATPNAATITFSSIPQTFKSLLIVHQLTSSGAGQFLSLNPQSDTTAGRFSWINLKGSGSTATSSTNASDSRIVVGSVGSSAAALGVGFILIPNYAAATANRCAIGISYDSDFTGICISGGFYNQAVAWTSLLISATTGTFLNGSVAMLYGIGG